MRWDNPLDQYFFNGAETFPVIGVVKDFHYESLHYSIRPGAIFLLGDHAAL